MFFAQDTGTHNLVYASAASPGATQSREAIAFPTMGSRSPAPTRRGGPTQKVTTEDVLGRGVL